MGFISDMKIKNKLTVMLIIPFLSLIYFSATVVYQKVNTVREMAALQDMAHLAVHVSKVVHSLQKERGRGVAFLQSGGKLFSSELNGAISETDAQVRDFDVFIKGMNSNFHSGALKTSVDDAVSSLDTLRAEREAVKSMKVTPEAAMNFYTGINGKFFNAITVAASISSDSVISSKLLAYNALLQKKEYMGLERAVLSSVFVKNAFMDDTRRMYFSVRKAIDIYAAQFYMYSDSAQRQLLADRVKGKDVDEAARIRSIAAGNKAGGFGIKPTYWFDVVSAEIDLYRDAVSDIVGDIESDASARKSAATGSLVLFSFISLFSIGITAVLAYNVTRRISAQVSGLIAATSAMAGGDLARRVESVSGDEFGSLGAAFNDMGQKIQLSAERERLQAEREREAANDLKNKVELIREGVGRIATGDLSVRFGVNGDDALSQLGAHLNTMTQSLSSMARQISEATGIMNTTILEVQSAIASQSSGATEQAASINQTTSSLEEIKATSNQTQEKAAALGRAADRTRIEGEKGVQSVEQTVGAMQSIRSRVESIADNILALSEQTQQIGDITTTVNNLAQQLKMLALNASIEASKAGEAGKGFSVVAAEVKNLAEQSQQATAQVHKILHDIQHATDRAVMVTEEGNKGVDHGVMLVEQTGKSIKNLTGVISETAIASQQIVAAVRQEAVGIDQISMAMSDINKATSQFVSSIHQTAQAVKELGEMAAKLKSSASVYKF